jgi:pyridoxal 5'-phosphate synthase pdxS subunit
VAPSSSGLGRWPLTPETWVRVPLGSPLHSSLPLLTKAHNGMNTTAQAPQGNSFELKVGLARMLCNGVIMDVIDVEQARIAEDAGAVAVMALERVPSDIRKEGGVARMSDPQMIEDIKKAVSIPVMAKVRIGHLAEAQILEAIGIDFIDESEVLTPADPHFHVDKHPFKTPFVCGATYLGEALRRINEGAAMIRTKGEAGTGNIIEAVRHLREVRRNIDELATLSPEQLHAKAVEYRVPVDLLLQVRELKGLPVPNFAAGGVATPADAALCRQLGAESVFVGSGIFKSENPLKFGKAVVEATCFYNDPKKLLEVSRNLGKAMPGLEITKIPSENLLANRGW